MNQENKQQFVNNWNDFLEAKNGRNYILFKAALNQQIKASNLRREGSIFVADILKVTALPMVKTIKQVYNETGVQWANQIRLSLPAKKGLPMGFSQAIIDLINTYFDIDFLNVSEQITAYTRDIISNVLTEANQAGESFNWIVRKLEERNIPRSRLIARTETIAAANNAGHLFAETADMQLNKEWLSITDNRTRLDHEDANGQTVPLDGFFIVGGYEMKCPGDKGGKDGQLKVDAKEVCNCRCTTVYSPILNSKGVALSR